MRDSEKAAAFAEAGLRLESVKTGIIFSDYIKNLLIDTKITTPQNNTEKTEN
jgi:hypothetical protein